MSNELDTKITVIPPTYSLPVTGSQSEPNFIDVSIKPAIAPSNTIIFSKTENMGSFVSALQSYVEAAETGAEMLPADITNATTTTNDIAVAVQDIPLPETLMGRQNGLISNERGAIGKLGTSHILIIPIDSPIHPTTGERITLPGQNTTNTTMLGEYNTVQIAQSPNIEKSAETTSVSQLPTGPAISYDNDLTGNPYLKAPAKLE